MMVKPIKKRVPKSENTPEELEGVDVVEDAAPEVDDTLDVSGSERLRAEIHENAHNESADRFSEVMEGFLLGMAENWMILILLIVVGVGVYGFIQYNDHQHKVSLADGRAQISATLSEYQKVQGRSTAALESRTQSNAINLTGASSEDQKPVEAPKAEEYQTVAKSFSGLKVSEKSAPLVTLAQASAQFDAASSSEEFVKVAELFTQAATQSATIELVAKGIALKNAAVAYEEAARLATDKAPLWKKAISAWDTFGESGEVYRLNAQVNKARLLRTSGDLAGARKLYQELERGGAQSSDWASEQIKLGLALTAPKAESKPAVKSETKTTK
jgi:hypothetical protein